MIFPATNLHSPHGSKIVLALGLCSPQVAMAASIPGDEDEVEEWSSHWVISPVLIGF